VKSDKKANGQQMVVPIDTTDILFIGSGAFTSLDVSFHHSIFQN
jgi:ATP-dependent protease Clp ATPase subunit